MIGTLNRSPQLSSLLRCFSSRSVFVASSRLRRLESWQLVLVDRAGTTKALGKLPPACSRRACRRMAGRSRSTRRVRSGSPDLTTWLAARRLATGAFPMWSGDGQRVLFIVGG